MERIRIDLGKGVVLSAPIKSRMTIAEWNKMTQYVNRLLAADMLEKTDDADTLSLDSTKW